MSFNANDCASRSCFTSVSIFHSWVSILSTFSSCGASYLAKDDVAPVPELFQDVPPPVEPVSSSLGYSRLRPAVLVTLSTAESLSCSISDCIDLRLPRGSLPRRGVTVTLEVIPLRRCPCRPPSETLRMAWGVSLGTIMKESVEKLS